MAADTIWPIEPHTKAKHAILRRHLDAWLPIMASANSRILVLDFFAGPGVYTGGEAGSPIIALRALGEHRHLQKLPPGHEIRFFFVEQRQDRAQRLQQEVNNFLAAQPLPAGAHVLVIPGEFAPIMDSLLANIEEKPGVQLAPAFAFIDPFGFAGIPMDLIVRFAKNTKCEALISFMFEPINRWAWYGEHGDTTSAVELGRHIDGLFGTETWRTLAARPAAGRRAGLVRLYREQLHRKAGFSHVLDFEMVDRGNRTEYFLYFATKSPKGLSVMKRAMWTVDPVSGQIFSDRVELDPQLLLVPATTLPMSLRDVLRAKFRGAEWVSIEDVINFVLLETVYSESMHLKQKTLKLMEKESVRVLDVKRPLGKHDVAGQYPSGTKLRFL